MWFNVSNLILMLFITFANPKCSYYCFEEIIFYEVILYNQY